MPGSGGLQPTLWRTCRVLANKTRLRLLELLLRQPGQTVSAVARQVKLPPAVVSQYLRTIEARGLLSARRVGRWVEYRPHRRPVAVTRELIVAVRQTFRRDPTPVKTIIKLATAFTHSRRIAICRVLECQPRTLNQLRAATRISMRALRRHLSKLEARGFVTANDREAGRIYASVTRSDPLGRELVRMATARRGP